MKRVYTAATLPEAHLVRHLLQTEGIRTHVFNENGMALVGELPLAAALPQVWVADDAHAARARMLIDRYESRTAGPARKCSECGEESPGAFEICWHCGRAFAPETT